MPTRFNKRKKKLNAPQSVLCSQKHSEWMRQNLARFWIKRDLCSPVQGIYNFGVNASKLLGPGMLIGKHWKWSSVVLCKKWRIFFFYRLCFPSVSWSLCFLICPVKCGPVSVLRKNLLGAQSSYFDTRMLICLLKKGSVRRWTSPPPTLQFVWMVDGSVISGWVWEQEPKVFLCELSKCLIVAPYCSEIQTT